MRDSKGIPREAVLDNLTFSALLAVLQGGLWLLNDVEGFLGRYGMSHGRLTILLAIQESPDGSMLAVETARMLGKSKPTIARMIRKLEEDGFVTTRGDGRDGRAKRLSLTPKAAGFLRKAVPPYNQRLRAMSARWSRREKRELVRIVSKIDFLDPGKRIRVPR